jgi:hypothetical protein
MSHRRGIIVLRDYGIHRVPQCLSLCRNQVPLLPTRQASVAPTGPKWGGDTLACGEDVRGLNSDEGIETPVLYVCYNPSTV